MRKQRLKKMDLDLYSETLDNGLLVNLVAKKDVKNVYATFSTSYGSFDNDFVPLGEKNIFNAPLGIAHFLEHKLFETENGEEPFAFFTKNGADSNAFTSHQNTSYLFSGIGHLEENVEYLLNFVQQPYFTDANVEKEKGIIDQEIKMYDDIPYFKLFDKAQYNTFINHPLKHPIIGTSESINSISKEDLYKCYKTFYHPSNMYLTIVGNIEPEKLMGLIKENQSKKEFAKPKKIKQEKYKEPDNIERDYEEIIFDVELPKVALLYKINTSGFEINRLQKYLDIYFRVKADETSPLLERLKSKLYIHDNITIYTVPAETHILFVLLFESMDYKKVLTELEKEISDKQIDEKSLNRKKKVSMSRYIYRSDNITGIAYKINNDIIHHGKVIIDEAKEIESLNIDEMNDILSKISLDNKTTTVLKRKEES